MLNRREKCIAIADRLYRIRHRMIVMLAEDVPRLVSPAEIEKYDNDTIEFFYQKMCVKERKV